MVEFEGSKLSLSANASVFVPGGAAAAAVDLQELSDEEYQEEQLNADANIFVPSAAAATFVPTADTQQQVSDGEQEEEETKGPAIEVERDNALAARDVQKLENEELRKNIMDSKIRNGELTQQMKALQLNEENLKESIETIEEKVDTSIPS